MTERELDMLEQARKGLFKDGKPTAKGQAMIDEDRARRRQRHGYRLPDWRYDPKGWR